MSLLRLNGWRRGHSEGERLPRNVRDLSSLLRAFVLAFGDFSVAEVAAEGGAVLVG